MCKQSARSKGRKFSVRMDSIQSLLNNNTSSADSSRLTMHGVKRAFHDGEDRDSKRRDISVRDIDVNQHFFFVLTSSELDDEFKSSRAYQEEICAESGDIGIFAVAQFRANPSPPDDEVLDWWPHKEGILVIKLRPGLICENDWWGLRVRLFWGFGDSNPRLARFCYIPLQRSPQN
ncbi:hypothetical protein KC337_g85 [Hortaea werneckii]|nr:hypothetical protein KC337_g85 [Hortaea werneckii]